MGYIEPVSAPVYALLILGQVPSVWTIAGGALIIGAGVIVVRYGAAEIEPELPGFALVEPGTGEAD
jgi:drug/metabolite transporter (DMT)-like permease